MQEEKRTTLKITRMIYRGSSATFALECEGVCIHIEPDKIQKHDLAALLFGGGIATITLPCWLKQEVKAT